MKNIINYLKTQLLNIKNWLFPHHPDERDYRLDDWSKFTAIYRRSWIKKPGNKFEEWQYNYEPTYADERCTILIYNYIETDKSLRQRIKNRFTTHQTSHN